MNRRSLEASTENPGPPVRGILFDIALNAIVPLRLYRLSKRYISPSELTALSISAVFPLAKSIFDLLRRRQFDGDDDPGSEFFFVPVKSTGATAQH